MSKKKLYVSAQSVKSGKIEVIFQKKREKEKREIDCINVTCYEMKVKEIPLRIIRDVKGHAYKAFKINLHKNN